LRRCILATCQRWEEGSRAAIEETAHNPDEVRSRAVDLNESSRQRQIARKKIGTNRPTKCSNRRLIIVAEAEKQNVHAAINRNWQRRIHVECNIHEADAQKMGALKKNPPSAREREMFHFYKHARSLNE
jgi:hypothetical protein